MSSQPTNHDSDQPGVHRITEARESHTSERDTRVRKYTISMTVRMICFVLAFFFDGWLRWVFVAGAVVLPYVAVVVANGGADLTKREPPAEFYKAPEPEQLAAPPTAQHASYENDDVIDGTFVDQPSSTEKED
ncbi:DUF3099 domain-containing protein [Glutamicibacter sp. JC586]|uniref:DUF3099 domain-containing protein n=1 Tax=Glutamicibacter sp. JC586 TaxID=2590552 RepID=UPI0013578353|nr:DUF3099 domain-containing protein [Glutamicibacter sp. JC586]